MAHRFPFNIPSDQSDSSPQPLTIPAADIGARTPRLQEIDLSKKSDEDAVYELVTLGTQYSSAVCAFSGWLQTKTRGNKQLFAEIDVLHQRLREANRKVDELKQQNKDLKSLLSASVRLPNPLNRGDMLTYERLKHLKEEARQLKFL